MTKKVRVAPNLAIAGPFRSGAASRACACGRNPGGAGESPALLVSFGPERVLFHPWAVGLPPGSPLPAAVAEPGSRRYPRPVHDQRRHPCTPPRNPSISLHLSVRRWAIRKWRGTKLYAPPFGAALGNPEMAGRQTVRARTKNAPFPNRKLPVS